MAVEASEMQRGLVHVVPGIHRPAKLQQQLENVEMATRGGMVQWREPALVSNSKSKASLTGSRSHWNSNAFVPFLCIDHGRFLDAATSTPHGDCPFRRRSVVAPAVSTPQMPSMLQSGWYWCQRHHGPSALRPPGAAPPRAAGSYCESVAASHPVRPWPGRPDLPCFSHRVDRRATSTGVSLAHVPSDDRSLSPRSLNPLHAHGYTRKRNPL